MKGDAAMIRIGFLGVTAVVSAGGLVGLAEMDLVSTGAKLAEMGSAAFLGVGLVTCVVAIVRMYTAQEKNHKEHSAALLKVIETATGAIQASTDATRANTGLGVEVKTSLAEVVKAIQICAALRKKA